MQLLRQLRRAVIRSLIGRMEVCTNMTIVDGEIEYGGRGGGVICDNNQFLSRRTLSDSEQRAKVVEAERDVALRLLAEVSRQPAMKEFVAEAGEV